MPTTALPRLDKIHDVRMKLDEIADDPVRLRCAVAIAANVIAEERRADELFSADPEVNTSTITPAREIIHGERVRYKRIPLYVGQGSNRRPCGLWTILDAGDYEAWAKYLTWRPEYSKCDGKVRAYTLEQGGKRNKLYLHRMILGAEKGQDVDHRDGNPLNNRRYNLRLCSRSQNAMNQRGHRDSASGYKGVSVQRYKQSRYYIAAIRVNGKLIHLGSRSTAEAAARLYDEAAREHFGEYACVNFPRDGERRGAREDFGKTKGGSDVS